MKIVTIIGARPQFIKAAVVSRAISEFNKQISADSSRLVNEVIVHTGQHYDQNMSDVFFEEMEIPKPEYFLDINGLSHGAMTGQMLEKIEPVLVKEKPDVVLVYGDTNTTLAGALAAAKLHIPIAHVEAGLRSFNRKMPEEINRVLTDHVANFLFCPTDQSVENLKTEGILSSEQDSSKHFSHCTVHSTQVCLVGDVMLDAALYYKKQARRPSISFPDKFILATIHRAENTDSPLRLNAIIEGFEDIGVEIPIILPLHPRTRNKMEAWDLKASNRIQIIDPVSYFEMVYLLENCALVMTDSGGLQKEAFFFKKPCITLREETEWVELVKHGFNLLAGTKSEHIYNAYKAILETNLDFSIELYGEGRAGKRIVEILVAQ